MRQLTRPLRAIRARTRSALERRHHRAELAAGRDLGARTDRVPVFVLGAPRSGTTLLYQLLVEALDVGYLANAHAEQPSRAVEIERRERPRTRRTSSDFESTHGATADGWGPSEAGGYWYRFFAREPHEVTVADATSPRTAAIRSAVRAFAAACAAPVVFKNVFNSLRIPVLAEALPEARFIYIERDEQANARSLLAGRVKRGDLNAWWSARPAGAEQVAGADPATQVVWQVRRMNEVARRELDRIGADRGLLVSYEQLCSDPRGTIDHIHAWLRDGGVRVERREGVALPERFELRAGGTLTPELEAQLEAALGRDRIGEDAR